MPSRPYHHGNLRETLLAHAERTVRERGADVLSLRELAREAGVSHAAPRRHFADRQALLTALAETGFDRLGAELGAAVAAVGADASCADRLLAAAHAYLRFATDDAALLGLMFAAKRGAGAQRAEAAADRAFAVLLGLIEAGQAEGVLEPGDPLRLGIVLLAGLQGIAALVTGGLMAPELVDRTVDDAVARFLRGAAASAPRTA
jgi:AcrR family transcriptional regulator